MRKLLLIGLLPLVALAAVYEAGIGAGPVFLSRSGSQSGDENFFRLSLYGGYQFNATSDQLLLTFVSDQEVDELELGYALTLPSWRSYTPFSALPYAKGAFGLGNTYAESLTLTHASFGLGAGLYGKIGDNLRLRFEMMLKTRDWQLERSGEGASNRATAWQDSETSFMLGLGYLF